MLREIVTGVGKGLAPFLKPLAGAWWLAQFDPHSDAAAAARQAFQAAFPGPRQREALAFCRQQVCSMACCREPLGALLSHTALEYSCSGPQQRASSKRAACIHLPEAEGGSIRRSGLLVCLLHRAAYRPLDSLSTAHIVRPMVYCN